MQPKPAELCTAANKKTHGQDFALVFCFKKARDKFNFQNLFIWRDSRYITTNISMLSS